MSTVVGSSVGAVVSSVCVSTVVGPSVGAVVTGGVVGLNVSLMLHSSPSQHSSLQSDPPSKMSLQKVPFDPQ